MVIYKIMSNMKMETEQLFSAPSNLITEEH